MSLHSELIDQHYRDCIGQIHLGSRTSDMSCSEHISQNGQLYLAQAILLMELHGELQDEEIYDEEWANYSAGMECCQLFGPGAYSRHNLTHETEWQSPDNVIGICAASYCFDDTYYPSHILKYMDINYKKYTFSELCKEILDQSKWYNKALTTIGKWFYLPYVYKFHEDQPLKQTFWGRQPGLIAIIKWSAGLTPTLFERFCFIIAQIISANTKEINNVDPFMLGWMASHTTKDKGFIYKKLHEYFLYKVTNKFKNINFGSVYWKNNPNHPNAIYWRWK